MQNPHVFLALYKGRAKIRRPADVVKRITDFVVRAATFGRYSHCEIAAVYRGEYVCYSASARDGGVRWKIMRLPPEKWDLIPLPPETADRALLLMAETRGAPYDWAGAVGAVLKNPHSRRRWFCSEWCAAALGFENPHNYTPQRLARAVMEKFHADS